MEIQYIGKVDRGGVMTRQFPSGREFFEALAQLRLKDGESIVIAPSTPLEAVGLLTYFVECQREGRSPPAELVEWLSWAFSEALDSPKPAKNIAAALGLKEHRRGRPSEIVRDEQIYARMRALIASGSPVLAASMIVGEEFGVHEANVQKLYYLYKKWEDSIPI